MQSSPPALFGSPGAQPVTVIICDEEVHTKTFSLARSLPPIQYAVHKKKSLNYLENLITPLVSSNSFLYIATII
jgi:hypothetical protein